MATLRDYYNTGDDGERGINTTVPSNVKVAQTFTAAVNFSITSVKIKLYKGPTYAPGIITLSITATTAGVPSGVALVSGTTNGNTLTAVSPGEWREITFSSGYSLTAGTVYAIVVTTENAGVGGDYPLYWRRDNGGGYAGGSEFYYDAAWSVAQPADEMFECYGDSAPPSDKTYTKQLIAIGNHELWYESSAGTMEEFTDANTDIYTSSKMNVCVAFQKLFIANETKLKIADFVNIKLTTTDVGAHPPYRGTVIGVAGGASMIVDYITASTANAACIIYGKRTTTATFATGATVVGTNPLTAPEPYGASGAISFVTSEAEDLPPHWYDWTVYGADATNFGAMPSSAYLICNFMGCLTLSGHPNYPHQWYMSRQGNPFDWLYAQDDAQSAVAGNDADAGEVGDIIKVNIPYKDDYVVHACATTLWYMTGHPCQGGTIIELDLTTGILGDRAFCWDDASNLYMMCTTGLLKVPPGFGQPQNLTIELWPDFITDLAFNSSLHRVTLAFNPEERGIHIFKTTLADGVNSSWWYDLRTNGLFPDDHAAAHGAFSAVYYQSENPTYRKFLIGCNDGYIRHYDKATLNDDGTAITSYVGFAPLALSTHPRKDGIIKNLDIVTGIGDTDSNNVTCTVHVARTAAQIIKKLNDGDTAAFTKVFIAPNWSKSNLDRRSVRGQWGGIVLTNNALAESWSMERLIVDSKEVGRSL